MTGTMAMLGVCVATTEPTVEHMGQMCDADGVAVWSAQKWNCAPRKTIPRSNAKTLIRCDLRGIYVLRDSLRRNGCGVKQAIQCIQFNW
jgi:hypothetical protein